MDDLKFPLSFYLRAKLKFFGGDSTQVFMRQLFPFNISHESIESNFYCCKKKSLKIWNTPQEGTFYTCFSKHFIYSAIVSFMHILLKQKPWIYFMTEKHLILIIGLVLAF
jgi:hypothetical protein